MSLGGVSQLYILFNEKKGTNYDDYELRCNKFCIAIQKSNRYSLVPRPTPPFQCLMLK